MALKINNLTIALAQPEDASSFIDLHCNLTQHESFLLTTFDEAKTMDIDKQSGMFEKMLDPSSLASVYLAKEDNRVIGFIGYSRVMPQRARHVAGRIAIGVHTEYRRKGIAKRLFQTIEQDCKEKGISRIEFTVLLNNKAAIDLYLSLGYEIEGRRIQSVNVDDRLLDEYFMAKILKN